MSFEPSTGSTVALMTPLRPIWTQDDALGTVVDGRAGNLEIAVCLPRPSPSGNGRLRAPELGRLADQIPVLHPDTGVRWGSRTPAPMPAAHVQHVVFLVAGSGREVRALRPQLLAWFRGLTGWLEVWTEQVLHTEPVKRWEPRLWQVDGGEAKERPYFLETLVEEVQQIVARGASHADWRRAAALADTPIPLAWEVIAAARQALEHGQHRRAAIECGTATEQAVTAAVGAAGTKLSLGRLLDERYAPLGLATHDEVERLKKRVVSVRNAAVHDGYQPTEREARSALRETQAIVNKHVPLSPDQRRPS